MQTITKTDTVTDIRIAFENFRADLQMLAIRTQAMELDHARKCADDVCQMAREHCLKNVHVQLYDSRERLVRVHRYTVEKDILSVSQRPGENKWPCLPDGTLCVLIKDYDNQKLEKLKRSGQLKINWGPSDLSTNYSGMRNDGARLYSSNSYGLRRDSFVN